MAYATQEISQCHGRPAELYLFTYGSTEMGAYTSSDTSVTYDGVTYLPEYITRDNISVMQDAHKTVCKITVTKNNEEVALFRMYQDNKLKVTIRRSHIGSADSIVLFKGQVLSVSFKDDTATMVCRSSLAILGRPGLTRRYSVSCPYTVYGPLCKATPVAVLGTVTAIDSNVITLSGLSGFPDTVLKGGYITTIEGYTRSIKSNTNPDTVELTDVPPSVVVGSVLSVVRGCDKFQATCRDVFSNQLNFGGLPFVPTRNPFTNPPPTKVI